MSKKVVLCIAIVGMFILMLVASVGQAMADEADGFHVVVTHSLQKVRRSEPSLHDEFANRVKLTAARDESEAFQLVVVAGGKRLVGVRVDSTTLKGTDGELPLTWNRVDYVKTAKPNYKTEYVGWWPDPLLPSGPFDVAADQCQPLWFTVTVPPEAKPGQYRGEVTVRHGRQKVSIPVEIRVRNFRLPRPGTLATAFGLYGSALNGT